MCGRYTGWTDDSDELRTIYDTARVGWSGVEFKTGEIFPTDTVPLLAVNVDKLMPFPGVWGFPGYKGKQVIINARSETVFEKPAFADSVLHRRCVVPTSGYLEWNRAKERYLFRRPQTSVLYLGGFFCRFGDVFRFVILTTAANRSVMPVHDRMPIILDKAMLGRWVCDTNYARGVMSGEMPELIGTVR